MRKIDELIPDKPHQDYINSRVNDVEVAAQRSRWLYGLVIAISWVLIAMAFNTTLSFMRGFAESREGRPIILGATSPGSAFDDSFEGQRHRVVGRDLMSQQLLRNWIDSLSFEVPVLGARFSAADAGTIGGVLLVILGAWCVYSCRRENHLIFYLVRDCEKYQTNEKFRKYLKNQLHATQVFGRSRHAEPLSVDDLSSGHACKHYPGPVEITIPTDQIERSSPTLPAESRSRVALQLTATAGIYQVQTKPADVTTSPWSPLDRSQAEICLDLRGGHFQVAGQRQHVPVGSIERWMLSGQVDWRGRDAVPRDWAAGLSQRVATIMIFFLPSVALLAVLAGDVATLLMNSPVRNEPEQFKLWHEFCGEQGAGCTGLLLRLGGSLALLLINFLVMYTAFSYQRATNALFAYIDQPCWTRVQP